MILDIWIYLNKKGLWEQNRQMSDKEKIKALELAKENVMKWYQDEMKKLDYDMKECAQMYQNKKNAFIDGINTSYVISTKFMLCEYQYNGKHQQV